MNEYYIYYNMSVQSFIIVYLSINFLLYDDVLCSSQSFVTSVFLLIKGPCPHPHFWKYLEVVIGVESWGALWRGLLTASSKGRSRLSCFVGAFLLCSVSVDQTRTTGELTLILLKPSLGIIYLWKHFVGFEEEITLFS